MTQNYKELFELAAAERRTLNDRIAAVLDYNRELDAQMLSPNGDDFNALLDILAGRKVKRPSPTNR